MLNRLLYAGKIADIYKSLFSTKQGHALKKLFVMVLTIVVITCCSDIFVEIFSLVFFGYLLRFFVQGYQLYFSIDVYVLLNNYSTEYIYRVLLFCVDLLILFLICNIVDCSHLVLYFVVSFVFFLF